MIWKYVLILLPAGILAGIASSVAGLASLVSYPALLLVGIPPVTADVTNTAALIFTGIGSTISSKRELRGHARELLKLLPLTVGGSVCGGLLLLSAPASSFEHIVPFFILSAALLIIWPDLPHVHRKESVSTHEKSPLKKRAAVVAVCILIFFVGAYSGYFGAAAGVVLLAILAATSHLEFAEYNALKNVALGASNAVAAILFAFRTHIEWMAAVPLAIGFFAGGMIGPAIVRRLPARVLHIAIFICATGLAVYLFVKAYYG